MKKLEYLKNPQNCKHATRKIWQNTERCISNQIYLKKMSFLENLSRGIVVKLFYKLQQISPIKYFLPTHQKKHDGNSYFKNLQIGGDNL